MRGAARPVFDSLGFCGGLVCLGLLVGLGEVVSPLPSSGGPLAISVVFCFLQLFAGFAAATGSRIQSFIFDFGVFGLF